MPNLSTKLKLLLNLSTFLFYQGEFSKAGPVAEAALALAENIGGPQASAYSDMFG